MVQVDAFWSYGIGAGFAVANTWQIEAQEQEGKSAFDHTSFRDAVLYLACFFVPSGAYLIWQFPSWETMHVGTRDMPGWLVAAFTLTNATQGMLGFAVAAMLLRRNRRYAAYLQWILGYFGLLFILVHGWDGTGYMRFFSNTREEFHTWTWATGARWWTGPVARSLMLMGIVMIPVMLGVMARDTVRGYRFMRRGAPGAAADSGLLVPALSYGAAVMLGVLGFSIVASVAIHLLGAVLGTAVGVGVVYVAGIRSGGVFDRHFRRVVYGDPFFSPVTRTAPDRREVAGPAARV